MLHEHINPFGMYKLGRVETYGEFHYFLEYRNVLWVVSKLEPYQGIRLVATPEGIMRFDLDASEMQKFKNQIAHDKLIQQKYEEKYNRFTGPLKLLKPINFNPDETIGVLQHEFAVTHAGSAQPILGTFGAGPCIILALYDKQNKQAFLAHIDSLTDIDALSKLLISFSHRHPIAHLYGGDNMGKNLCISILEILEKHQINIVNCKIEKVPFSEGASLAIDARTGTIYSPIQPKHLNLPLDAVKRLQSLSVQIVKSPLYETKRLTESINNKKIIKKFRYSNNEINSYNYLQFNSAVGLISASGETKALDEFLQSMKPYHINSFLGGTVNIQKLDSPLIVYRTGDLGKYWTTIPPNSPWQQSLDMAMHPSLYPNSMKEIPNFHPANKGVLMAQIPAGQIIATGVCAPQGGFPGMGPQIFWQATEKDLVRFTSWDKWIEESKTPFAYTTHWKKVQINGLPFNVENRQALESLHNVLTSLMQTPSHTVQSVLKLAKIGAQDRLQQFYAFDLQIIENQPANISNAITYFYPSGSTRIAFQTQDRMNLYLDLPHEFSHSSLSLAGNTINSPYYNEYANRMRAAICSDYWYCKSVSANLTPIHRTIAQWLYAIPQTYLKADRTSERITFCIQGMAVGEEIVKTVAPQFFNIVREYVEKEYIAATTSNKLYYQKQPPINWNEYKPRLWLDNKNDDSKSLVFKYKPRVNPNIGKEWQPTDFKRAPWYNRLNYPGIGRTIGTIATPFLLAKDFSNRLKTERLLNPSYSDAAHYLAVVAAMTLDYALYSKVAGIIGSGPAFPVMGIFQFNCELANALRYIPVESVVDKPDVLINAIHTYELPERIGKELLDDYYKGGSKSRDFMIASAQVTKTSYKPLEWIYDAKKFVVDTIRTGAEITNIARNPFAKVYIKRKQSVEYDQSQKYGGLQVLTHDENVNLPTTAKTESIVAVTKPKPLQALSFNTTKTLTQLHDDQLKIRTVAVNERDNHIVLNMPTKLYAQQHERSIKELSWEELGPDQIDKLVVSDPFANQYNVIPSYGDGLTPINSEDYSLTSVNVAERSSEDPELLHAKVENKTQPLQYRGNNNVPYQTSRAHTKKPSPLIEGVAVTASMTGACVALKLNLCVATGVIGFTFVVTLEILFSWKRRHEAHKLKRKIRHTKRVNLQCGVIQKELDFADLKIDEALQKFDDYLFETDLAKKTVKREALKSMLNDVDIINSARAGWTARWANAEDEIKAEGHHSHKVTKEARHYAKEVLKDGDYARNNEVIQECKVYVKIDEENVEALINRLRTECKENKRFYICFRISELLRNNYSDAEMQILLLQSRHLYQQKPNDAENKIVYTEILLKNANAALGKNDYAQAKNLFNETLVLDKHHIEAKCGLLLANIHQNQPMQELVQEAADLKLELQKSLQGKSQDQLNSLELELYILNSENINRIIAKLNDHTVVQYGVLLSNGQFDMAKSLLQQNSYLQDGDKIQCLVLQAKAEVKTSQGSNAIATFAQLLAKNPNDLALQCGLLLAEAQTDKSAAYLQQKLAELKGNLEGKMTPELSVDLEKVTKLINNKTIIEFDDLVSNQKLNEAKQLIDQSHLSAQIKHSMTKHLSEAKNIIYKNEQQRSLDAANEKLSAKNYTGAIAAYDDILAKDANNFLAKCGKLMAEICIVEKPELILPQLFASIKKLEAEAKASEISILDGAKYKVNLERIKETVDTITKIRCYQLLQNYEFDEAFDLVTESVMRPETKLEELKDIKTMKVNYYVSNSLQLTEQFLHLILAAQTLYQLWFPPKSKLYAPIVQLKKTEFKPFWQRESLHVSIVSEPKIKFAPHYLFASEVKEIKPQPKAMSCNAKPIIIKQSKYF